MSLKEEGNLLFKEGKHKEAAVAYTKALKQKQNSDEEHILYSNRSAAFLQMGRLTKALEDANTCIQLKPDWPKGWFRKARALEESNKLDQIKDVLKQGLSLDPDSTEMRRMLKKHFPSEELPLTTKQKQERDTPKPSVNVEEPIMGQDVVNWGRQIISEIQTEFEKGNANEKDLVFRAQAYLLPSDSSESQTVIAVERAFASPEANIECVYFLRDTIKKENCKGALIIAQKSTIGYPQRWKNKTSQEWNFDEDVDGLFIQMETTDVPGEVPLRVIHFLPMSKEKKLAQEPFRLDIDLFSLMPPLFRDVPPKEEQK